MAGKKASGKEKLKKAEKKACKQAIKENIEFSPTIFDDVYRTLISRMPQFVIPVINDAFGTKYSMDTEFEQLKNEFYRKDGRIVTDSIFLIEGHIYYEQDMPKLPESKPCDRTKIKVTKSRSFEAAMRLRKEYPYAKIAVHNFASATNPGGGVTKGSRAQEECLCRCSTLYPVLNTESNWNGYYGFHRGRHDVRYTDACIYTPGIKLIKSDTDVPERLPKEEWCEVDILTCAAPNLRAMPNNAMNPGNDKAMSLTDEEVLKLHISRARHLLRIAAANGDEVLVLGAFGCGAFQNKPEIVAQAYKEVLPEFDGYFKLIEFAVYCSPRDENNYRAFARVFG